MDNKEKREINKNRKSIIKILMIIIGLTLLISLLFIIRWHYQNKNNTLSSNEIKYKDYIYKIRYDFGCESYIYLLKNNIIKTVNVQEVYKTSKDCNCMEPTGKYDYEEKTINFSKEVQNEVIEVFNELYKKSGNKEFNADNIKLTKYQQRVLLALMTNNEDQITIEKNVKYKETKEEIKNESSNLKIENSKEILDDNTKNKTINNIANYLNKIVNYDFKKLNNDSKNLINTISENSKVNLKLELAYVGPYSISFTYTKNSNKANHPYNIKGYTFNYAGKIHEFDMNGIKDKYYKEALHNFMNDELYTNNKEQLKNDWKDILYEEMYLTGNWYLADNKLVFLIPAHKLGYNEQTAQTVTINVKIDEDEEF